MARDLETCPHRRPAPARASSQAVCGLLADLSGDDEARWQIPRAACQACCEGSPPSPTHLNPILASLLYERTNQLLGTTGDGVPELGGEPARLRRLRDLAVSQLFLGVALEPGAEPTRGGATASGREPRRRRPGRPPRLGLIGGNVPTGLGSLNRSLVQHLPVERWLVLSHPSHRELAPIGACQVWRGTDPESVRAFLDGLDWLLFCEQPQHETVVDLARERGVRVACVPMWEHLDELARWIRQVDLMICPTRYCRERLGRWRERLDLRCELALVSWPIDLERFPFEPRRICRRFLFIHGRGGMPSLGSDGNEGDGRKGLGIIRNAARLAPSVSIIVQTQLDRPPPLPANVEVRCADLDDQAALYQDGDVCVQPSRWEGLGLPLLECQAAGLPLITSDAPPMNEHQPWRTVPVTTTRGYLARHQPIPIHTVDPAELARVLLEVQGADVTEASLAARRYVEREHSWAAAGPALLELLTHV